MRKHFFTSAMVGCLAIGAVTSAAGAQTVTSPDPATPADTVAPSAASEALQRASGVIAPGTSRAFDVDLAVNDLAVIWAANTGAAGGPALRLRFMRWGFAEGSGALTNVVVGTITVASGASAPLNQVATTSSRFQLVVDAPGATGSVPFSLDPTITPSTVSAIEHPGQGPGAVAHITGTSPDSRDVRYLSEPATRLTRWRIDLAAGDNVAFKVDNLGYDKPSTSLVACLLGPGGNEVATVTVPSGASGILRYAVPSQGHYTLDTGCRPGAPTAAFQPYYTPRPGRVPGSTSFVAAGRLVPRAGTQNGGALERYWRIDLVAGQTLDIWFAPTDPEVGQGTLCIEGPSPTGGLGQVAALPTPRGTSGHLVMVAPVPGRYVINGACNPGEGLFEMFVN